MDGGIHPGGNALIMALWRRIAVWRALWMARRDTERALQHGRPRKLLVVCHGNIYRSPFVEAVLEELLGPEFEVRSAGFHPVDGRRSPLPHVEMCHSFGVSLADHRSRVVSRDDLLWAELIILMDRRNWLGLAGIGADRGKLVWLGALNGDDIEIPDPYGMAPVAAEAVVRKLDAACRALVLRLA